MKKIDADADLEIDQVQQIQQHCKSQSVQSSLQKFIIEKTHKTFTMLWYFTMQKIKELVWVDTVGWDDVDLQGNKTNIQ